VGHLALIEEATEAKGQGRQGTGGRVGLFATTTSTHMTKKRGAEGESDGGLGGLSKTLGTG